MQANQFNSPFCALNVQFRLNKLSSCQLMFVYLSLRSFAEIMQRVLGDAKSNKLPAKNNVLRFVEYHVANIFSHYILGQKQ